MSDQVETIKEEMKVDMVADMAVMLMERTPGLTMEQALDTVFNSDTYRKMMDDRMQLYYQSPGYVFSFLDTELKTGKMG